MSTGGRDTTAVFKVTRRPNLKKCIVLILSHTTKCPCNEIAATKRRDTAVNSFLPPSVFLCRTAFFVTSPRDFLRLLHDFGKYVLPSIESLRNNSDCLFGSDYGEGCLAESESQCYPVLTPVYNGTALDIPPQFVHASLSGISIKHYYGKCSEEEEDFAGEEFGEEGEAERYEWFQEKLEKSLSELSRSFESMEGQPLCTVPRMNYRNSFWNIHRPELCKLTWGQNYVSAATVTDHLHGHLLQHGPLCQGFHTEKERQMLLDKELDEYVRLKVLASPRGIPPDEPVFFAQTMEPRRPPKKLNPRCKAKPAQEIKIAFDPKRWFIPLPDDEDDDEIKGKSIHRLKEEFCLTIGKHKRLPPILESPEVLPSGSSITSPTSTALEEEVGEFFFKWNINDTEETFCGEEDTSTSIPTQTISFTDSDSLVGPCPPLIMDEFCKAAGKVDFSDLRCPDL